MNLESITDREAWDHFVSGHAYGHPLQLWGWGESKRTSGWVPDRLALKGDGGWTAAAEVLSWRIPKLGKKILYVPRGPVAAPGSREAKQMMSELAVWARQRGSLYLRVEPAWTSGAPGSGWVKSKHHVQLPETYVINLERSTDELLEPMSRKHRQYIRKSERDGVQVVIGSARDIEDMYQIYTETAERAGFGIHGIDYYRNLLNELADRNFLYLARADGKPVAFLWLAAAGRTAYELYGGVTTLGGELKANYFLKWQAISYMKQAGYISYDFNGRLNEGVSRFKEGFGPAEVDYIGTWDSPVNRVGYEVWQRLWPVAKPVGRWAAKLSKH